MYGFLLGWGIGIGYYNKEIDKGINDIPQANTGYQRKEKKRMTEKKEMEYVNEAQLVVSQIEVIEDYTKMDQVKQVRIHTSAGIITHKPKQWKEEYRKGFLVKKESQCLFSDLPQILKDMAKQISENGKCVVKASYTVWNTENDNHSVTYRFVKHGKTLDKWQLTVQNIAPEQTVM